jgi:hypothetical protein
LTEFQSFIERWQSERDRTGLKSFTDWRLFHRGDGDETILLPDETISCFGVDIRKQRIVIKLATERRTTPA